MRYLIDIVIPEIYSGPCTKVAQNSHDTTGCRESLLPMVRVSLDVAESRQKFQQASKGDTAEASATFTMATKKLVAKTVKKRWQPHAPPCSMIIHY